MSIVLLILLFVVAWVVLILPKQRELRRHNALVASLVVGDEVMSGSGIYGTITAIEDDVVHLEVAPGVELKVARRAVATKVLVPEVGDEDADADADAGWADPDGDELVDGEAAVAELDEPGPDTASDGVTDDHAERS